MRALLPESWFVPVPVKKTPASHFWVNEGHKHELKEAAELLNHTLYSDKDNFLNELGIKTSIMSDPFTSKVEWDEYQNKTITLWSERFFDPYCVDVGAGRNANLGPCQFKGIGRNNLAIRPDWLHSWGGMTIAETITEIVLEKLLSKNLSHLSVPVLGGFIYHYTDNAFIIRSSDFIRCHQLHPIMRKEDRDKIFSYMARKLCLDNSELWHRKILENFITLMKKGFYHQSPTLDNLTIDGRILDHYSLEWSPHENDMPFSCEITFDLPLPKDANETLIATYLKNRSIQKVVSNYDFLAQQFHVLARGFEHLELPTISTEEMITQLKDSFPEWKDFILRPEEKRKKYPQLLLQKAIEDKLVLYITNRGTIIAEAQPRKRAEIVQTSLHMLNMLQMASKHKDPHSLNSVLHAIYNKFNDGDISQHG
jgi:hypothetical protein